jgi:DNA-binding transcriptional MerR regulator
MNTESRRSLAELARLAGVTPRTVRYYIVQGLLPGANDAGPGAWYDERHLSRLRLIRELQKQHLPLAEIRARLAQLGNREVAQLLRERAMQSSVSPSSALDYVRGLLGTPHEKSPSLLMRVSASAPAPAAGLTAGPAQAPAPPSAAVPTFRARFMRARAAKVEVASDTAPATTPGEAPPADEPAPATPPATVRSQWDRIALTDDIELHVRRPLSRLDNKRVERLITIARQVLGENQP